MPGHIALEQEPQKDLSFLLEELRAKPAQSEASKRAMLASLVATPELGERVQQEVLNTGRSSTEDMIRQEGLNQAKADVEAQMGDILLQDIPLSEKKDLVRQKLDELRSQGKPTLRTMLKQFALSKEEAQNENEAQIKLGVAEHISEVTEVDQQIANLGRLFTFEGGGARQLLDTIAGSILPGWQLMIRNAINEVFPGSVSISSSVLIGDDIAEFKQKLQNLPPEERLSKARELVQAIESSRFWTSNNGFLKFDLFETLLADLNDDNFDIVLNNIFSALDLVGIGLIRGSGKLGKLAVKGLVDRAVAKKIDRLVSDVSRKSPDSVSSTLDNVAPAKSREIVEAALEDETGEVAQAVGESKESLTGEHILPKQYDDPVTVAPDLNDDIGSVLFYDPSAIFATRKEIETSIVALDERLDALATATPRVHLNKTGVRAVPGGYQARYYAGDTALHGYSNLKLARSIAKTFREFEDGVVTIMARKWDTGEFVPLEEANLKGGKNEYLIRFDVTHKVSGADALSETPIIREGGISGRWAKWVDKSASMVRWIRNAGNIAAGVEAAKVKALNRVMEPLNKLSSNDQAKVLAVLDKGDKRKTKTVNEAGDVTQKTGKWFTEKELLTEFFAKEKNPERLIEAYKSVELHQKLVRKLINDSVRRRLVADGVKEVTLRKGIPGGTTKFLGREVTSAELRTIRSSPDGRQVTGTQIREIWDVDLGDTVPVTDDLIRTVNENGGKFIRLTQPLKTKKGQWTNYVYLKKDTKHASINQLPAEVIQDLPGYISRIYDAPYILKRKVKRQVDGVFSGEELVTVRMYTNKSDALADKARMDLEAKANDEYVVVESKELRADREYANGVSLEYLENSGQLYTSRRGVEIKGLDERRELKSVTDSILAGRARAARAGTIDLVVDKLAKNWEAKYAKYSRTGRFSFDTNDLVRPSQDIEKDVFNDAVALQEHIKLLAGIDDSRSTKAFRDLAINFAGWLSETFDTSWSRSIQTRVLRNRHRNPINAIKGAAFTTFLIFKPVRQLFLQAQQISVYLGVDHGLKYFTSRKGMQEYWGLMNGMLFRTTEFWDKQAIRGAKALGMSVKEYENFVDAFRRTGITASIDSHQYAGLVSVDRNIGKRSVIGKGVDYFNDVRRVFRRIGFDLGEETHRIAAFLAARNKWIKENPKAAHLWDRADNLATIAGDAENLAFNMTKAGALQFQKGVLGLMFQFLSHTTKATQVLLPKKAFGKTVGKFASDTFNGKEKARIAAIQLGLYGTGAFGLNKLWESFLAESGIEVSPEFNQAVEEGIVGTLVNFTLGLTDDDNLDYFTDVEFSTSYGPFSGIAGGRGIFGNPVGTLIDAFILSDISVAEFALGPAYQLGKSLGEVATMTKAMFGVTNGIPQRIPNPDEAFFLAEEFTKRFVPMYGDFVRGRTEYAMNRHISNSGRLGVEITDAEARMRQYFGLQPRRQRQVQEELIYLQGVMGNPQKEKITSNLDNIAKTYYKYAVSKVADAMDGKEDPLKVMEELDLHARGMREILDEDEWMYIYNYKIKQLATNDLNRPGTGTKLAETIVKGLNKPVPHLYDDAFYTRLKNMTPFEGQDEAIQWLQELR